MGQLRSLEQPLTQVWGPHLHIGPAGVFVTPAPVSSGVPSQGLS